MNIKSFLLVLKLTLNEKYPNLKVDIYIFRRNWYVRMGLDQPLHSISYFKKLINDIESIWTARKHNGSFVFLSWIDSFSKVEIWLFDHKKKGLTRELCFLELVCVPFKRQSIDARVPLTAYPTSPGYDLYAAESKILKPRERVLIKLQLSNWFLW